MGEMDYGTATATPLAAANTPPKSLNSEITTFDVRISRGTLANMQDVPVVNNISDEKWREIEAWLQEGVSAAIATRKSRNDETRTAYRKTLAGVAHRPAQRRDQSNLSVPLTVWASAAVRARVRAGTIENDPLIVVVPNASLDDPTATDAARKLVTFFDAAFRNPRELGGLEACDQIITGYVPMGTGGLTVDIQPDRVRWVFDAMAGRLTKLTILGRVHWDAIAEDDLIYPLGFGTNTQAMPFVGRQFIWSWQDMLEMQASGYLNEAAVESVKGQGISENTSAGGAHVAYQTHDCDMLYFDYPLFDDGLPVALVGYRQTPRGVLLGLRYSYIPRGVRPISILNFDRNPDATNPEGQGVCEKLAGVQDETDLIHNLGIESAKRAIAHVIVLRTDSGADDEFGGDVPILPGDHISTERPSEDVVPIALGSPEGMQAAIAQEMNSLKYVMRLLGLDESALGNVESGKRVPASLGLEIKKDSRVITSHAIANFGEVMTENVYLTMSLWKLRLPEDTLIASLGPAGARLLKDSVFSTSELDLRSRFIINFNATDAAATEEAMKQQLLVVGQYLQGHYDRIIKYAQLAATMPAPLQTALMDVLQKMENGTRALLNTIDAIHNPSELLPKTSELAAAIAAAAPPPGAPGAAQ